MRLVQKDPSPARDSGKLEQLTERLQRAMGEWNLASPTQEVRRTVSEILRALKTHTVDPEKDELALPSGLKDALVSLRQRAMSAMRARSRIATAGDS